MRAMVLAAGLGTRLLPLTKRRPKCLMPVMNRPLLGLWLESLAAWSVERAVINTHHLAPMVRSWLRENPVPGLEAIESFEPEILGTGGGPRAARRLLGEDPFLLVNSDVLCTARLPELARALESSGALAVLGVVDDARFNTAALDADGRVLGFKGDAGPPADARWRTYSGLAALAPRLLDFMPPEGYSTLVQGLRSALEAGELVLGLELEGYWDDLGTPERLWGLHRSLAAGGVPGLQGLRPEGPATMAHGAYVDPHAALEGFCVLGPGARVEAGARVRDSLLLPGARAAAGARVSEAVLGDGFTARGKIEGGAHA